MFNPPGQKMQTFPKTLRHSGAKGGVNRLEVGILEESSVWTTHMTEVFEPTIFGKVLFGLAFFAKVDLWL